MVDDAGCSGGEREISGKFNNVLLTSSQLEVVHLCMVVGPQLGIKGAKLVRPGREQQKSPRLMLDGSRD
jgi:hypothetical protein